MGQSESNKSNSEIQIPKRGITTEFLVGIFTLLGLLAIGYQAIGLGGTRFFSSDRYEIKAEFDNVSGLKKGAPVEIAGVPVGDVARIELRDPEAIVVLRLRNHIQIYDEDIAAVRTQGLIGDRYVKISRGGSLTPIPEGGVIIYTESVVDIEDIIGKIVHSLGGDDAL